MVAIIQDRYQRLELFQGDLIDLRLGKVSNCSSSQDLLRQVLVLLTGARADGYLFGA
jgi:hypothetical protein